VPAAGDATRPLVVNAERDWKGRTVAALQDHRSLASNSSRPRPHVIYLAIGFPPAAKSSAYRLRETANQFAAAGWDVTVVNICQEAWEREYGLDHTLSERVDPRIKIVELPLVREDLETDIRKWSEARAVNPVKWRDSFFERNLASFPEPVFGGWRGALEEAVLRLHREHPADLLVASCVPYVNMAAAWKLWETHQVPYVIDFRDGWSLDVMGGGEAFDRDSVSGEWESRVLAQATAIWTVNDPIAGFYRDRYPELADRVRVVRNGFDEDSLPELHAAPDPDAGLTFGYLGSVSFSPDVLDSVLTAWRMARRSDPLVARSRLEFRGHFGAGGLRNANSHTRLMAEAASDGVAFLGPVPKAEVASVYASWDALLLLLPGGRYMSSGKVYEVMASGLPIVSAHAVEHDASVVLAGHPLWTGAVGFDAKLLARSFVAAAHMAATVTDDQRRDAAARAKNFSRAAQLRPAVAELTALIAPGVQA
jgi:glycosyltransferase involved in cell wall biosynthesis